MAKRCDITADYARQLLDYNPETGVLTWKARTPDMFKDGEGKYSAAITCKRWNKRFSGKPAGWEKPSGYLMVCIEWAQCRSHHVVWLMETGEWPKDQIDHRNGVRSDNRYSNLREATNAQNRQNTKRVATNTSGYTGVSWHKQMSKWAANINHRGHHYSLGLFDDVENAYAAYLSAKAKYHQFQPVPREP